VIALLENPIPIISFGIVAEVLLSIMLVWTGRGVLLWAMGGVLLLVLAGVGLEWLVETDAEQIQTTLYAAAAAIETNRKDELLELVEPAATETRELIALAFKEVEFTRAKITHLQIKQIDRQGTQDTAEVEVKGIFSFKGLRESLPYENRFAELDVYLQRQNDRWLVSGHDWDDDPRRK